MASEHRQSGNNPVRCVYTRRSSNILSLKISDSFVLESTPELNVITVYDGASERDRVPRSTRGVEGSGVVLSGPRLLNRLLEESSSVFRTLR